MRSAILLGIMGMWAVAMFAILMARAGEASALAAALWSYATATGAWTMLAQRMAHERSGAGPPALFNQIGCLGLMFYALTDADPAWPDMALWYGAPAFTCLAAQILFAVGARTRLP